MTATTGSPLRARRRVRQSAQAFGGRPPRRALVATRGGEARRRRFSRAVQVAAPEPAEARRAAHLRGPRRHEQHGAQGARAPSPARRRHHPSACLRPSCFKRLLHASNARAPPHSQVNTYRAFADDVLPRVKKAGYNTIQLMAVMVRGRRLGAALLPFSCACFLRRAHLGEGATPNGARFGGFSSAPRRSTRTTPRSATTSPTSLQSVAAAGPRRTSSARDAAAPLKPRGHPSFDLTEQVALLAFVMRCPRRPARPGTWLTRRTAWASACSSTSCTATPATTSTTASTAWTSARTCAAPPPLLHAP